MATIYEAILKDHAEHRALLEKIADTSGDSEERRTLWDRFYYDVKSHAAAEEETFYSRLIATEKGQPDARHSVHEHQEMDDIMEELQETEFSSPGWLTRFKQLRHDYEHHMDEEEAEIFARAREVLKGDTEGKIGAAFERRKKAELKLVDKKADEALEE